MNCKETKEYIQLFLDNELDARATLSVQQHLENCASCTKILKDYSLQDQLLQNAAFAESTESSEIRLNVLNNIRRELEPRWQFSNWTPLLIRVAAVLILLILGSLYLLREGRVLDQKVYAAVAQDHTAHCSIDNLMGAITNKTEVDQLFVTYSTLKTSPDLSSFGYKNPRARVCKVGEFHLLHTVYYSESAQPLSLFVGLHSPKMIEEKLSTAQRDAVNVASISKSGTDFLLVTNDIVQANSILQFIANQS